MTQAAVHPPRARAGAQGTVEADVSHGFGGLARLQAAWEALFVSRQHEPCVSFEWTTAMVRHHVRPDDRCVLVHLRRDDTTVGLVPLIARPTKVMGARITILSPLSEHYNTHSDLLLEAIDDEVAQAFVGALRNLGVSWDCFRMARLLEDDPLAGALRRALEANGVLHSVRQGLPAYVLLLPASFDEYLGARSAKFRNHLKRSTRKLHAAGDVRVHELTHTDAFEDAYDALLLVERASWKEWHGTSITAIDHQTAFRVDL